MFYSIIIIICSLTLYLSFYISDKAPSEATFRGTEFLSYDLGQTGGEPIVSAQDAISLYFRTRQPNGLLFYTGKWNHEKLLVTVNHPHISKQVVKTLPRFIAAGIQKPFQMRFKDNRMRSVRQHKRMDKGLFESFLIQNYSYAKSEFMIILIHIHFHLNWDGTFSWN